MNVSLILNKPLSTVQVGIQISRLTSKSAAESSGTVVGNKSLLDFMDRGQSNSGTAKLTNAALKPSNDATTTKKAKPHIPTMLDYVAKQPQSEINKDKIHQDSESAEEQIVATPARERKLPPLPSLPDFKTPSESGTPVARLMKSPDEFSMPTPSQVHALSRNCCTKTK